jgi:hypothetical protein
MVRAGPQTGTDDLAGHAHSGGATCRFGDRTAFKRDLRRQSPEEIDTSLIPWPDRGPQRHGTLRTFVEAGYPESTTTPCDLTGPETRLDRSALWRVVTLLAFLDLPVLL